MLSGILHFLHDFDVNNPLFTQTSKQGENGATNDATEHINWLELKAAQTALKSAVAYIENMEGSHFLACNQIAQEIRERASDCNIWLSVSNLPGALNVVANKTELFTLI